MPRFDHNLTTQLIGNAITNYNDSCLLGVRMTYGKIFMLQAVIQLLWAAFNQAVINA